jgi:hypothetical protein
MRVCDALGPGPGPAPPGWVRASDGRTNEGARTAESLVSGHGDVNVRAVRARRTVALPVPGQRLSAASVGFVVWTCVLYCKTSACRPSPSHPRPTCWTHGQIILANTPVLRPLHKDIFPRLIGYSGLECLEVDEFVQLVGGTG